MLGTEMMDCLADAGCTDETARRVEALLRSGEAGAAIQLLRTHRQTLLERKHQEETRIDCLDYLVFQLKKEL